MMILAESIFTQFSNYLGIPSFVVEGGLVGVLVFVVARMVAILFMKEKEDVKQLDLPLQLVTLISKTMEGFDALQLAIKANTEVLLQCKIAFEGVAEKIGSQMGPIQDGLEQVRKELISNKKTRVVFQDSTGKVIAEVLAQPMVDDNGDAYLLIQYDMKSADDTQKPG